MYRTAGNSGLRPFTAGSKCHALLLSTLVKHCYEFGSSIVTASTSCATLCYQHNSSCYWSSVTFSTGPPSPIAKCEVQQCIVRTSAPLTRSHLPLTTLCEGSSWCFVPVAILTPEATVCQTDNELQYNVLIYIYIYIYLKPQCVVLMAVASMTSTMTALRVGLNFLAIFRQLCIKVHLIISKTMQALYFVKPRFPVDD